MGQTPLADSHNQSVLKGKAKRAAAAHHANVQAAKCTRFHHRSLVYHYHCLASLVLLLSPPVVAALFDAAGRPVPGPLAADPVATFPTPDLLEALTLPKPAVHVAVATVEPRGFVEWLGMVAVFVDRTSSSMCGWWTAAEVWLFAMDLAGRQDHHHHRRNETPGEA